MNNAKSFQIKFRLIHLHVHHSFIRLIHRILALRSRLFDLILFLGKIDGLCFCFELEDEIKIQFLKKFLVGFFFFLLLMFCLFCPFDGAFLLKRKIHNTIQSTSNVRDTKHKVLLGSIMFCEKKKQKLFSKRIWKL